MVIRPPSTRTCGGATRGPRTSSLPKKARTTALILSKTAVGTKPTRIPTENAAAEVDTVGVLPPPTPNNPARIMMKIVAASAAQKKGDTQYQRILRGSSVRDGMARYN